MNITRRYKLSLINNTALTEKEQEIVNDVNLWILSLDEFLKTQKSGEKGRVGSYTVETISKLKLKYKDDIDSEDLNDFLLYMLNNTIKYLEREIEKDKDE